MKTLTPFDRVNFEVENLLSGREYDLNVINSSDPAARLAVSQALLTALAPREENQQEAAARRAFMQNGYFDELTKELMSATSPEQRASAAEKLAIVCEPVSTKHLIAALHDESACVRRSAVIALRQIGQPEAIPALNALLLRETDNEVPQSLIRECINAIAMGESSSETRLEEEERLRKEEENLRLALEELEQKRRDADAVRRKAEEDARLKAEMEARAREEDEARFRLEAETLRRAAEELAQKRATAEQARLIGEHQARLRDEEKALVEAASELSRRRAEIEEAKLKAEEAARALDAVEQRIREQEEQTRTRAEEQNRRLEELEMLRNRVAEEVRQGAEQESRLRDEIEALQKTELEQRERINTGTLRRNEIEARIREEETRLEAEEQERIRNDEQARAREDEHARLRVEAEEQARAEEHSRLQAEERARLMAEEEAQIWAQEETERQAAAEARARAEAEARNRIPTELMNRLKSSFEGDRAASLFDLARIGSDEAFSLITEAFDDDSTEVRNAAARALYDFQLDRAASFTAALRHGSQERRRRIGAALAESGLANDAIGNLTDDNGETSYDAFSLLFLMAKAGEVQPLMRALEDHVDIEVRLAVVKLLALSGQPEIVPAFRRLAVRGSLPSEVRSAVMEAIYQISSQTSQTTPSAA
jgi:HEAT repeat protein